MLASLGCTSVHRTTTNQVLPACWAGPSVSRPYKGLIATTQAGLPDHSWSVERDPALQQRKEVNEHRCQEDGQSIGGVSQARQQMHLWTEQQRRQDSNKQQVETAVNARGSSKLPKPHIILQ